MKGLLLKDLYLMSKYCRTYVLIILVFAATSFLGGNNQFFLFYMMILSGMIPMTLYAYDEREKWLVYSETLPCTRAQLVSAKYTIGALVTTCVLGITAIALFIVNATAENATSDAVSILTTMLAIGLIAPALLLPFIFKLGAEKGRVAYYFVIGLICALGVIYANISGTPTLHLSSTIGIAVIVIVSIAIYAGSWLLSISYYSKREF